MDFFLEHFGFEKDPFENIYDPNLYYISTVHRRALGTLYRCAIQEGITCVIGGFGTGKTSTIKKFLSELKETPHVYIFGQFHSFDSVLDYIVEELDLTPKDNSTNELISLIKEYADQKRLIIVLDDVQNFSLNVLENLRLLVTASDNIKLILVGNEFLDNILNLSALQQLKQRIRATVRLKNLNKKDTRKYIDTRIYSSGTINLKITSGAYKFIHKITDGNPYMINLLMEEALYIAFRKKKTKITKSTIKKAAKNLKLKYKKGSILGYLIGIIVIVLAGIIIYSTDLINVRAFLPVQEEETVSPQTEQSTEQPVGKVELPERSAQEKQEYILPEKEPIKPTSQMPEETEEPQYKEETQKSEIIGKKAKINVPFINLRAKPDTTSKILAVIPENYEVRILEERTDGWVKVAYYSKRQKREIIGWMKKKYLKIEEEQ